MSKREYQPNRLNRRVSAPLRVEDWEIFYALGPGVRRFYGYHDRRDAEVMFARVDGRITYSGVTDGEEEKNKDRGA